MQEEKAALEVLAEELKALKRDHVVVLKDLEEAKAALVKQEETANKLAASLESRLASETEQVCTPFVLYPHAVDQAGEQLR